MSIEAMRQALVALEHAVPRSMKQAKEQINAIQALRTAIQQAEAKTGVTVAWIDEMLADTKEVFDANGTETPQVVRDVIEYVASWITVYNEKRHPAPGVPDDVVRDAERYRWLRDRDHWPAPFASSQDPEPVRGIDLDAAIDAAMLAASPAQKGGE